MSVLIGHASIDENGNFKNGIAGDQTGKEVCVRNWYNKSWGFLLRAKDSNIAEIMAKNCEYGCNNNYIGYDQNQRNTLKTQASLVGMNLSRVSKDCECDCSSFMTVCAECAGIKIPYNGENAPTTSTMKTAFMNTGAFELLTDMKYLTSDKYLKRGDILVKSGSHTVMVLSNGSEVNNKEIKTIDISKYNTIKDYKLMATEIENIIIRVGYRSYEKGVITEDTLFKKHITNCLENGMNVGVYFYDQSVNEAEAIEQAKWVIDKLKYYNIKLPIFIDSEYSNSKHNGRADNISAIQRTKNIIAFCDTIQQNGYVAGVYSSDSFFKNSNWINYNQVKDYIVWCARYNTIPPTINKYDIWQCGSQTFIWADKAVDVNIIYNLFPIEQNKANINEIKDIKDKITINNVVKLNDGTLNIRLQPTTNSEIVGKLNNGDKVSIYGYIKGWYMINQIMSKWVYDDYIETTKAKTTGNLNYRQDAGTNAVKLGTYPKDNIVNVLNKKVVNNKDWFLCVDDNDRFGWCSGDYLTVL